MCFLKYIFIMYNQCLQHDQQKLNGHKRLENESASNKDLDERVELLHQIRNKVNILLYESALL